MNYSLFAYVYDDLMEFPYDEYAKIIKSHIPKGEHILDLACGTGTLIELLKDDYKCTGADLSEEMLEVAQKKNPDVPFFIHNLIEPFHMEGVEHIICTVDSLNYIVDYPSLERVIDNIAAELKQGSYFVFDIYADSKLQTMENYSFSLQDETLRFDWKSTVDERLIIHDIDMTLDAEDAHEVHYEYVYTEADIETLLHQFTFEKTYMTDRIIYIAKRK